MKIKPWSGREFFKGVGIAFFLCSLVFAMAVAGGLVSRYRTEFVFGDDKGIFVYPNYGKSGLTPV